MRRWGADIRIVSTRPPPERDRARHAFATAAEETTYLFLFHPQPYAMLRFIADAGAELVRHPAGIRRAVDWHAGFPSMATGSAAACCR